MKLLVIFIIIALSFCNYQIQAIDTTKDVEGVNCAVTEKIGSYTFNFTDLASEFGYHINGNDDDMGHYSFNVCKNLSRKCNSQTAAACLKTISGTEVVIGYDSKLFWNNGQIRLSYVGEECATKKGTNYTLNVLFHCYYGNSKNDFLGVFHGDNQCEITIIMRTPKACLEIPENVKNAKLFIKTSSNKLLNFNALKSSNHIIYGPKDSKFIIGFPIAYEFNALCEAGSSICHVNNTETDLSKKYTNLGFMTSDIMFVNDRPVIKLTTNEMCNSTQKLSSEIVFECDQFSGEGSPKYKGTSNCVNHFIWETSLACSNDEKPCVLTGENGEVYDFSSLTNVQYQVTRPNKTDETIYFSICSKSNKCGEGSWGSCIVKKTSEGNEQITNIGTFNTKLQLEKKNVFLKYEGGKCNDKQHFSTRIEFNVADDQADEVTVLVEDNCDIVIHFKTLLANQHIKNCVVKNLDDEEIDLRPLINYEENYNVVVNEKNLPNETSYKYLLNVCRPLNSFYSLNCHGNTGACRTKEIKGKHEEELSLGHYEYFMSTEKGKVEGTTNVIMKYFHGSKCPTDSEEDLTTKITFFCDESAGHGNPILQSIDHCEYLFDFPTSVLCNEHLLSMKNDSCQLVNDKSNTSVDLKPYGVFKTNTKSINLCDSLAKTYKINYKQSMVIIEYSQDKVDVEVQLKCSSKNNTFVDVSLEEILIMNESTLICPIFNIKPKVLPIIPYSDDTNNGHPNSESQEDKKKASSGFSLGYFFLIATLVIAFATFYVVIRNPERREIIRNMIKFRSRGNVRYSRINISEESALLVDSNNHMMNSDSDDENILL